MEVSIRLVVVVIVLVIVALVVISLFGLMGQSSNDLINGVFSFFRSLFGGELPT